MEFLGCPQGNSLWRSGQDPVQKISRNGRIVAIFTVGTGGMFDQRISEAQEMLKPAQWHHVAVQNEMLGAYAVQLAKNSSVYVEGGIETRVYNDSINNEVKSIPEICACLDGPGLPLELELKLDKSRVKHGIAGEGLL